MRRLELVIFLLVVSAMTAIACAEERFPAPEFRGGYTLPVTQTNAPRDAKWAYIDTAALLLALSAAAYLVLRKRSRRGVFVLMVLSLLYFGFYREGCICPIGSIQNVTYAINPQSPALPWLVAAFFALPLFFALFFGRVFCSSVCPLGAIQDIVLWRSIRIPNWLEESLNLFAWFYLGAAILFAFLGSDFIICRYDPFVAFFRLSGAAHMIFYGGVLLAIGMVIGRPYCRFMCPYGVLLRLASRFSKHRVSITPSECIDCRLCEQACPFGAIRHPLPKATARQKQARRREVAVAFALLPVLIGSFAVVGRLSGPPSPDATSRFDFPSRSGKRNRSRTRRYQTRAKRSAPWAFLRSSSMNRRPICAANSTPAACSSASGWERSSA